MTLDIEIVGIGITAITPMYGALWYLVTQATTNKTNIINIQTDVSELKSKLNSCKNCIKGVSQH